MSEFSEQSPAVTVEVPVVVEQLYEYQPTDENGLPIGGKQVLKYTTEDELRAKLVEQNTLLLRKLREKTRKERLGIIETDEIPTTATKFITPIEFTPRELTHDEYTQLAADLVDPSKAADARRRLFEAEMGASPEEVGATLRNLQEDVATTKAVNEANAFQAETPEYYPCPQNAEAIAAYISRYDLAPVKANYKFAFNKLSEIDPPVLIARPFQVAAPSAPVSAPVEVLEQSPAPPVRAVAPQGLPSGLTRENAGDEGFVPMQEADEIVLQVPRNGQLVTLKGLAAVEAMSGDEYGRRLRRDKNFQLKVDALIAAKAKAKQR